MTERIPTCREVVELVTEYLEGTMPAAERERLELHLTVCNACRIYIEQMRETIALTGELSEESLPPQTRDALIDVFKDWNRG
jgi:predicted anti-sigma-YlaC factor YlaD